MSQIQKDECCCQNVAAYHVVYHNKEGRKQIVVCVSCLESEQRLENYPDTLFKPFQTDAKMVVCKSCDENVTDTMGCNICHPKEEQEKND